VQVRRLVVYKQLVARMKDKEKDEVRTRSTALLLLNAMLANGLRYADDEATVAIAGGHWRRFVPPNSPAHGDAAAAASPIPDAKYTPATAQMMHDALFRCLTHKRKALYSVSALVLGEVLKQMSGAAAATADLLPAFEARIQAELSTSATSDFTQVGLYKILFHFEAFVHESILRVFLPPALPALLQYDHTSMAQCTTPPTTRLYAIHPTILVITISCNGQLGLYKILFSFWAFVHELILFFAHPPSV